MADSILTNCEIKKLGLSEDIVKLIMCPVCRGIPIPPIWNCMSGHIVCDQCRSRLREPLCGLCRLPYIDSRNLFMESVLRGCELTCPYFEDGCEIVLKGEEIKTHAMECKFGPKIQWITCRGGQFPETAVLGGKQNNVNLYVIRSTHQGSTSPGKLFEYTPAGCDPNVPTASLAWGGGEHMKIAYEVLVTQKENYAWVPSRNGEILPTAIRGGTSENNNEPLFIGRFKHGDDMICGKIHPSHECCYIGVEGREKGSREYEILIELIDVSPAQSNNRSNASDMPAYYS